MSQLSATITTVYEAARESAERFGEQNAIRFIQQVKPELIDQTLTYQQLFKKINQTARFLQELMGGKRGVVSILAPNIPQNHILLWAAESIGIANPLNPLLNEDALVGLMEAANTDVIVALGENPASDIWQKATAVAQRLPNQPKCVSMMLPSGDYFYDELVAGYDDRPLDEADLPTESDIAAYFHTGGTTGLPKLAMHTHRNQITTARAFYSAIYQGKTDISMNGLPLFHVAGAMVMGLGGLVSGSEQILPTAQGFRNPDIIANHWRLVEHYGITLSGGIPTSVASMMEVEVGNSDLSSLRFMVSGGSPVPAPLVHKVKEKLQLHLHQIYGMTESAGSATMPNLDAPAIPGAAGHLVPGVDVKVDERGEICLKGDNVFPGYLGIDDKPVDDEGWLHTGDLGHIDNGYLFITGRAKDLIIRSGHNIDPALIENCLDAHPAVTMSAAVGKPDDYAGELPVAYVQLAQDQAITEQELHEYVMNNIDERPACPKQIFIIEEMPVTAVGKIHKPTLREMAATTMAQEQLRAQDCELPTRLSFTVLKSGLLQLQFDTNNTDTREALTALAEKMEWSLSE